MAPKKTTSLWPSAENGDSGSGNEAPGPEVPRSTSPDQYEVGPRSASPAPMATESRASSHSNRASSSNSKRTDSSSKAKQTTHSIQVEAVSNLKQPGRSFTDPLQSKHLREQQRHRHNKDDPPSQPALPGPGVEGSTDISNSLARQMWKSGPQPLSEELVQKLIAAHARQDEDRTRYQELADIKARQERDQKQLPPLKRKLMVGRASQKDLARIAQIATESLKGLRTSLQSYSGDLQTLELIPTSHRSTYRSPCSAQKVFNVTELCEIILSYLRPLDVLRFRIAHADVDFARITGDKPGILGTQKWLEYTGDLSRTDEVRIPIEGSTDELGFTVRWHLNDDGDIFEIEVVQTKRSLDFSKLCERVRPEEQSMNIIVPPIYALDFYVACCTAPPVNVTRYGENECSPTVALHCKSGVNIGHVIQTYAKIQREHRLCPHGEWCYLDAKGFLWTTIRAQGQRPLRENDENDKKILELWENKFSSLHGRPNHWHLRMKQYTNAKRTALANGEAIPTLAEFEARMRKAE